MDISSGVYTRLRKFMDTLPSGYPSTSSGIEMRILEKLFTPEEAEMAMELRLFPEPPAVIAKRIGKPEAEVAAMLDSMARRGLLVALSSGKQHFYQAMQYCVGVYEFQTNTMDKEFAEMAEQYDPYITAMTLKQFRVVPINEKLDTTTAVASYDRIRDVIKKNKVAAVTECICKTRAGLIAEECKRPTEVCMSFGIGAQYYIDHGKGRQISIDEALRIIDQADENAMVVMPTNSRDIINVCCCCTCCCQLLAMIKASPRPVDMVRSPFQARVDKNLCKACKKCIERCQVDAITIGEGDKYVTVDLARCIGCGLCTSTCKKSAMSLVPKSADKVPMNYFHLLADLAKGRGLGFGKLNLLMKLTKVPLFVKMLPLMYKSGVAVPLVNLLAKWGWV